MSHLSKHFSQKTNKICSPGPFLMWNWPGVAVAGPEWTLCTAAPHVSFLPSHPRGSPLVSRLDWPAAGFALRRLGKQIQQLIISFPVSGGRGPLLRAPWLSNFSTWFLSFLHCCRMLFVSCSRACSHDWSSASLLQSPGFSSPSEPTYTKEKQYEDTSKGMFHGDCTH